ncbi:diphosphomevalonate decarboxylase [Candidatus Roizmanbacteria bacterium RIFCSPHIGHO2_02_FULL_37_15]|uniref:diphosphomevalonate decarboxylase n=1 Tax=Candidatus Roizmanbacteria bacterium RIFCSPLOWO2_01_FULL_37_16 TaxID=1802058 RepID=A0A1F7IN59_9BACT|nr:MAG: diphosphomevalonate decarboxylase [Candidatus Roizmanbacteria bacterium RIFCSPHIGHO2_01_FULL_37_16b]OGK21549.1 MAG: diphosphomevalonate decarboxylase [Candidatus Roizmanbacteria bacterium RIFCSPHIGHO2_02_FULL_37_15]OGK44814.1 MAG: diphosphomevalonate decarboxylase [Candidatus Roizmanbacteria bacterium RIFCSPLOWO2_01_FULL_37_16]OGK56474.1 MAG: diphosphomevalonate decarboxylase [Candidatus Roizmanbacteria bacterium RIFCSPLOWO2_02_FULL_37_9]
MKATAVAPSNIAFIKYWGKKNERLRLPSNGSISVNLNNLFTTTTVEFSRGLIKDEVVYNNELIFEGRTYGRVTAHLDRIRKLAKIDFNAKTVTKTNFPSSAGLASSASGYAAFTVAASTAAGLELSEKELSVLARLASGSACRSIPNGYVEWLEGSSNESSYALSIFPPNYWKISVVVVIVGREKKLISSTQGHRIVEESPFFLSRLNTITKKLVNLKKFIKVRNFSAFGQLVEKEALELHALTLTSDPPIIYWEPETVRIMKLIHSWRKNQLEAYFTIDAGPNLFLITEKKNLNKLLGELKANRVSDFIVNEPSIGTRLISEHLF